MRRFFISLAATAVTVALTSGQPANAHNTPAGSGHSGPGGFGGGQPRPNAIQGAPQGRPATFGPSRGKAMVPHKLTTQSASHSKTVGTAKSRTMARASFSSDFAKSARRFKGGYWFRNRPASWQSRQWNSRYNCWCWQCPNTNCAYYWCAPYGCYFPVTYSPTGSYNYPDPNQLPTDQQGSGQQGSDQQPGDLQVSDPQASDPQASDPQPPYEDPAPTPN